MKPSSKLGGEFLTVLGSGFYLVDVLGQLDRALLHPLGIAEEAGHRGFVNAIAPLKQDVVEGFVEVEVVLGVQEARQAAQRVVGEGRVRRRGSSSECWRDEPSGGPDTKTEEDAANESKHRAEKEHSRFKGAPALSVQERQHGGKKCA